MAFPSFGPERRGAPVLGFTRIDDAPVRDRSEVVECDAIAVLDETLIDDRTARGLKPGGVIVVNSADAARIAASFPGRRIVCVDATSIALEFLGKPITNTAMLGALAGATGLVRLESLEAAIRAEMGSELASRNAEALKAAYGRTAGDGGRS
jgi:pyruvate ferredoxin oxidoreductase gamma subunit